MFYKVKILTFYLLWTSERKVCSCVFVLDVKSQAIYDFDIVLIWMWLAGTLIRPIIPAKIGNDDDMKKLDNNLDRCPQVSQHFDSMMPSHQRWFSAKEVAAIIGKTDQYVRNVFNNQKILGHVYNDSAPRGAEKKKIYMISKNVLLFLLEKANFSSANFIDRLVDILRNSYISQLLKIQQNLESLINGKTEM